MLKVSHGKQKMDKMERRRELPCVRRSRSLRRDTLVMQCQYQWKETKSDEVAKKKQKKKKKKYLRQR
jgi:hypothetical protein